MFFILHFIMMQLQFSEAVKNFLIFCFITEYNSLHIYRTVAEICARVFVIKMWTIFTRTPEVIIRKQTYKKGILCLATPNIHGQIAW